jgi:EAL domain-containing protein (putative c-di-GMP-specific phosphodiesterase class I)/CheY-like chemotaxis protein
MKTGHIRVLIAEDAPVTKAALTALITGQDSLELVGVATTASEAAGLANLYHPDVALLDVHMPGGGGTRAAREISLCSPRTQILAFSGDDDRSSVLAMVGAGAVGYLVKGTSEAEIVQAIIRASRGQGTLAPQVTGNVVGELAGHLARQARAADQRDQVLGRIRGVLARADEGGLTMVFQPIAALGTGKVVGFEALARFTSQPTQPPNVWFADAHEVGLGTDLELVAARRALRALGRLPAPLYLSVNLSPATIVAAGFIQTFGPVADRVVIEVTEHAPIHDYDALDHALEGFRGAGGRLAVDDAGAGFASLRHILRLRPDLIKLDLALTRDIHQDRHRRALASALISFAAELGADIVAEGIEQHAELAALAALGVCYGQGYHLGRPAPLPAADQLGQPWATRSS